MKPKKRRRQEARTWIGQFLVQIGRRGPFEGDRLGGYGPYNIVRYTVFCWRLYHFSNALLPLSLLSLSGLLGARFLCRLQDPNWPRKPHC